MGQVGWVSDALINPLVEVCLLSRMAREGTILLHRQVCSVTNRGYSSPVPRAPVSRRWQISLRNAEALILSDERMIIRKHADRS